MPCEECDTKAGLEALGPGLGGGGFDKGAGPNLDAEDSIIIQESMDKS